jgi:hypothetical protein
MSGPRSPILLTAALGGLAVAGCFRDSAPPLGCEAELCAASTTGPTTGTATGQDSSESTSTATGTTGEPAPAGKAFRINSLSIVDPHFFFEGCVDGSGLLDGALKMEIESGGFNLVLKFEEFALDKLRPELIEVESCDLDAKTCVPKPGQVSLQVPADQVLMPPCSQLDPAVVSEINVPLLHAPEPPCIRTARAELALPIEGAAVPINMRESQVVFSFDDLEDPRNVTNGLLYGFLTRASAEATTLSVLDMDVPLWPLIEAPTCMDADYLPSVDMLTDGNEVLTGVWLVANFTGELIELLPPP